VIKAENRLKIIEVNGGFWPEADATIN